MNIIQNDYGYDFNFVVTDSNAVAVDLTSSTVYFKVANALSSTSLLSKTCIIDTPLSGLCHYTTANTDFVTVGSYIWQLNVNWASKVQTYNGTENINVLKKL